MCGGTFYITATPPAVQSVAPGTYFQRLPHEPGNDVQTALSIDPKFVELAANVLKNNFVKEQRDKGSIVRQDKNVVGD